MEPDAKDANRKESFMRNFYLLLHMIAYPMYFITKNANLYKSFVSDCPVYFITITLSFMVMLWFYSHSCQGAGYQTEEPKNIDGLYFSEAVGIHLQVRAGYCRWCKKVILRRDHHCPWTGHCIGRDNNLYFLIFTSSEAVITSIVIFDILYSFYHSFIANDYLWNIVQGAITLGLVGSAWYITFFITIQTLNSIAINMTIWEFKCHDRITYLENWPQWASPFNKGLVNNFIEFFTMKYRKTEWEMPKRPNLRNLIVPDDVKYNYDRAVKKGLVKPPQ